MKLYLVRHGQSTGDTDGIIGGSYDDHLSNTGRQQADDLVAQLAGKGIECIYASSYHRAAETAEILGRGLNCRVEMIPDLRERDYGSLSGLNLAEAAQRYPIALARHVDYRATDPGGESYVDFRARVLAAFDRIMRTATAGSIAIVTHGGPITCLYRERLRPGKELEAVGDCSVLEIED